MRGWLVDILVGWLCGSIVGGIIGGSIAVAAGLDTSGEAAASTLGIVAGTVGGVALMRWRRGRSPQPTTAPSTRRVSGVPQAPTSAKPATSGPASDWYTDPFNRYSMRYFDGVLWTDHVSDGGGFVRSDPPDAF